MDLIPIMAASIIGMIIGAYWYSPAGLAHIWMTLAGVTQKQIDEAKKRGMAKEYLVSFLSLLIMASVVSFFIHSIGTRGASGGLVVGFFLWAGIVAPIMINPVLWERRPFKLYAINVLHYLFVLCITGAVLGAWG